MGRTQDSSLGWLALAAIVALVAWGVLGPGGIWPASGGFEYGHDGSAVPCEVPLSWHIARLDPDFGLSRDEAERAVRDAALLWEAVAGRPLFPHRPGEGLAIRFVFDERQEGAHARIDAQAGLDAMDAAIAARRAALDRDADRLEIEVARHNTDVESWNREGGAPSSVAEALERRERALQQQQLELTARIAELNRAVSERNRTAERLEREFPPVTVESGTYAELRRGSSLRGISVSDRIIEVFRFEDRDDLVLVLAHELGHALGLGHADIPDALMAEVHLDVVPEIQPADLELLRHRCPHLAGP